MPRGQLAFTLLLLFVAGFLAWLIIEDYPKKVETEKQTSDLREQIEELKKDEEEKKSMVEYLNTESYLDKQARIRLNLKKQGEEVVFVYKKDEAEEGAGESPKNGNPFLSRLKEWFNIIWPRD